MPTKLTLESEAQLQSRSGALRRELGLRDLVLAQIGYIVIPEFFGTAAKAGAYHAALWLLAIVLFFLPLAFLVAHLNRLIPLEGGLYEWARLAFGDQIGFLVAWNLWLYAVIYLAMIGMITTSFVAYALGPSAEWIMASRWIVFSVSCALIAALIFLARVGFSIGKWVTNAGGFFTFLVLGVLVIMPLFHVWHGAPADYHPLRVVLPPHTLFTLSVFSKMALGALCGFEYVAIFAGECRNPERNLARSIFLTAPLIALLYILGTSAILAFTPAADVDVTAAVPQALARGFRSFGISGIILPASVLLLFTNYLATFNVNFNGCARLPMVAGWDHLLPAWFTRLHPRYKTPVNSIYFAGGVAMVLSILALIGVGEQEAFEFLLVLAFAFYAIAYLALFAIPLLARKDLGIRPAWWLRIGAVSGLLMTLLYILLSVFPIVDVQSSWAYSVKTVSAILGANALGVLLYRWGQKKAVPVTGGAEQSA